MPGVERVTASVDTTRVAVTYDAGMTSPEAIRASLTEAGYPAAAYAPVVNDRVEQTRPQSRLGLL